MLILASSGLRAQTELTTTTLSNSRGSFLIILPTIDNFIKIVNMEPNEYESSMRYYGYHIDRDFDPKPYRYTNNSLDMYMYGGNGEGSVFWKYDPINNCVEFTTMLSMLYPHSCIYDLKKELQKYYTRTDGIWDMYVIETSDFYYGFTIAQSSDVVRATCKKFKK